MSQEITTLEIVPADAGIHLAQRESLQTSFAGSFQQAAYWRERAESITEAKDAREARLGIRKVRTGAEAIRKQLKEESLRMGKAIDGANNILLAILVPIEERMEGIEKAEERAEQARVAAMVADRTEQLTAVGGVIPANLAMLLDEQFAAILRDAAELQRIKREREAKEEADRKAKVEADRLERIRIEEENARLKTAAEEAARLAKIEADRIAAERAEEARKAKEDAEKREAAFAAERAKAEAAARAERDKLELARRKAEAETEKVRKQAAAIAAERAKAEAASAAKRKAELAAAAKAARAPDKEKLVAFLASFKGLSLPSMTTPDGEQALTGIKTVLNRAYAEIKALSETL